MIYVVEMFKVFLLCVEKKSMTHGNELKHSSGHIRISEVVLSALWLY